MLQSHRIKNDPWVVADLPNALFFFILLPNHVVHFIQPLAGLFVRLQLHLAVLKGCLRGKKGNKNRVQPFLPSSISGFTAACTVREQLTSSFFWLDCRMVSFSCRSFSCSSRRELILSVAAVN